MLFDEPGSLGLFPSIYFYNSIGKFIEGAFLGMAQLIIEKERDNNNQLFINFTIARNKLEIFLVKHKVFLTQINRKFGSSERSYRHFKGFFENLIGFINEIPSLDYSEAKLIDKLKAKYEYLNEKELDYKKPKSGKFSPEQKKRPKFLEEEILSRPKCKICFGILHPQSISGDHKAKHEGGGVGKSNKENYQSSHHYCNNSRARLEEIGFYIPQDLTI